MSLPEGLGAPPPDEPQPDGAAVEEQPQDPMAAQMIEQPPPEVKLAADLHDAIRTTAGRAIAAVAGEEAMRFAQAAKHLADASVALFGGGDEEEPQQEEADPNAEDPADRRMQDMLAGVAEAVRSAPAPKTHVRVEAPPRPRGMTSIRDPEGGPTRHELDYGDEG